MRKIKKWFTELFDLLKVTKSMLENPTAKDYILVIINYLRRE